MSKMCDRCLMVYCSYEPFSEACQSARIFKEEQDNIEYNKTYSNISSQGCDTYNYESET